jgi:hypothetical protein
VSSGAKLYYDPDTGGLRFAGESIVDLYPWTEIVAFALSTGISFVLLYASHRRRKQLNMFPPDYTVTAMSVENPTSDDDLID